MFRLALRWWIFSCFLWWFLAFHRDLFSLSCGFRFIFWLTLRFCRAQLFLFNSSFTVWFGLFLPKVFSIAHLFISTIFTSLRLFLFLLFDWFISTEIRITFVSFIVFIFHRVQIFTFVSFLAFSFRWLRFLFGFNSLLTHFLRWLLSTFFLILNSFRCLFILDFWFLLSLFNLSSLFQYGCFLR